MSIISFAFFVFVGVCLFFYYLTPKAKRWFILLLSSMAFIVIGSSWEMYVFFVFQVLVAYVSAVWIKKSPGHSRKICYSAVALEMALLTIWKGSPFFIINIRYVLHFLGKSYEVPYLNWVAPMAMSYYTLILVGYLVDVYWGKTEPQKNPLKLILYAGFFPQMVTGPITRYGETIPQLEQGHSFDFQSICFGAQRIIWGLFKKLVVAERLGILVRTIYSGTINGTEAATGWYVWFGMFAYVFQLYADFSGGIDIIIGTAQLFGVHLPENFHTPFYSISLSEFWRRWHMTLGAWLKDYIMYPFLKSQAALKLRNFCKNSFGKKASKTIPTYIAMLLVWSYCGFWHGGTYKWIFWGVSTFVIIAGGMVMQPVFDRVKVALGVNTNTSSWILFGRLRTTFLFALTCSVQPAASLLDGLAMWRRAFEFNPWILVDGSLYQLGLDRLDFWVMIFGLLLMFVVSLYQQSGSVRVLVSQQNLIFRWAVWIFLILTVLVFGMYGANYNPADFIYNGF